MKNFFIVLMMKILNILLKICGKKGGNLLGKIAFDLNPSIFKYFKVDCPVIAVTATNGKTMTTNAIGHVFKTANKKVVSNNEGNNMETGILSTLLKSCTLTGKVKAEAERQSNELKGQTINDNIIKEKFIEKWNGELPKVMGNESIMDITSIMNEN